MKDEKKKNETSILPISIGMDGMQLRGAVVNYQISWSAIATSVEGEAAWAVTIHWLNDGKIGLHINDHAMHVFE